SLFLKTDGRLWGMGDNTSGQLGDGTQVDRASPVLIADDVAQIASGESRSAYVTNDNSLWVMGRHELPHPDGGTVVEYQTAPVHLADAISAVSLGNDHLIFVKNDGTVWGMGSNYGGKLGLGLMERAIAPEQIMENAVGVAAG